MFLFGLLFYFAPRIARGSFFWWPSERPHDTLRTAGIYSADTMSSHQSSSFGRKRHMSWRVALIGVGIVVAIGLIVLGFTGDFLVDWLWFSEVRYLDVFWTVVIAKALVFSLVFVATAVVLWLNARLAFRHASPPTTFHLDRSSLATTPDVLELLRHRIPWPRVIA